MSLSSLLLHRPTKVFGRALPFVGALALAAILPTPRADGQAVSHTAPDPSTLKFTRDSLRIYLMTVGPGDEVFELFGHNAIWVHDPSKRADVDVVYNWGVFDFRTPGFIPRFMKGDMRYWMEGDPLDITIAFYQSLNRTVWAQALNLTGEEKESLVTFLEWNALLENREYRYDYYRDNCSTRVRDAIDRVVGGAVRARLKSIKTDETYRGHSLRLMQGMQPIATGVDLILGRPTDVPLTADETSFLPMQLMKHIRSVKLDGGKRSLVGEEFQVYQAARPDEPTNVPRLWKGLLPIGLALGGVILLLGAVGVPTRGRRRALAAVTVLLAGTIGLVGLIIILLMTVTDHVAAHSNENLTMLNPLWLVLAVMVPLSILRGKAPVATKRLIIASAGLACVSVLIHLVGMSRQPNWDVIGLILPIELALAWVVIRASDA